MIIQERMLDGRRRPILPGEIRCPFAMHYHSGDLIEVELELIICQDQAEKAFKNIWEK